MEEAAELTSIDEANSVRYERAERLKRLRNMANLSRQEIEDQYNISVHTLKGWEIGRHGGLTERGAIKIMDVFALHGVKCSIDWLLHGIGVGPQVIEQFDVPETEEIDSTDSYVKKSEEEKNIIAELLYFRELHKHSIDMMVYDDAMLPYFLPGDYIAGVKRYRKAIGDLIGRRCIIQTKDGQLLFRQIRLGTEPKKYNLYCLNLETTVEHPILYNVDIVSAAPVVWHRSKDI